MNTSINKCIIEGTYEKIDHKIIIFNRRRKMIFFSDEEINV